MRFCQNCHMTKKLGYDAKAKRSIGMDIKNM